MSVVNYYSCKTFSKNLLRMIKLRLKRFGKKREASFRLVACNSTSRRDGRPLEELGFYNPRTKETRLDTDGLRKRLSQGAQPTDAVRSLLEKGGLIDKKTRPAELIGKANQKKERDKASSENKKAQPAEAITNSPSDDSGENASK